MKVLKVFTITLYIGTLVLATSCTKEDNGTNRVNIPSSVSVKVGSSVNLGYVQEWQTSRKFVATVTGEGLITGKHVGSCTISCGNASCNVTVNPATTLFTDPVVKWGASKSYVISIEGTPDTQTETAIKYQTNHTIAPVRMYAFDDNGRLEGAVIAIKIAYAVDVIDHITERYYPIGERDDVFYFLDGYSVDEATTIVAYEYYNSSYYWLMYMPNNISKGISEQTTSLPNAADVLRELFVVADLQSAIE